MHAESLTKAAHSLNFFRAAKEVAKTGYKFKKVSKDVLAQGQEFDGKHLAHWLDYSSPGHSGWCRTFIFPNHSWQEVLVPVDLAQLAALKERNLERFPFPTDFQQLLAPQHSPSRKRPLSHIVSLTCTVFGLQTRASSDLLCFSLQHASSHQQTARSNV